MIESFTRYAKSWRSWALAGLAVFAAPIAVAQRSGQSDQPPPVVDPSSQGTHDVAGAAATPLRNANLVRQDIPPVLFTAVADPYARPHPLSCRTLAADVVALNGALGDDLDAAAAAGQGDRGPEVVKVAANALIPFQGVVRFVSGAEARDRRVRQAIIAGSARRAYLKGLGEAKGCVAPAAPHRPDEPPPHRRKAHK
jgi:hypothetical protein